MTEKKTSSKLMQNKFTFIIMVLGASLIYGLPYFRAYYYDAYLATYNLNNTQMGLLGSVYGVFGMISYLFGGVLADKISTRKLLCFSLVGTGIGGLLHLTKPSFVVLLAIYAWWGITSLLAFWPAFIKGIRSLANPDEQGRAFGLMEGGRGVTNAIHLPIALAIFGFLAKSSNDAAGITGVALFYSVVVIILGILTLVLLKDTENIASEKFEFANIGKVLRTPAVWIISLILCSTYTMNMSFYYFTPYATKVFGATAVLGAILTMLAQYVRPLVSPLGGFIGDKIGCSKVLMIGFALMAIGTALIIFIPGQASMVPILIVGCVLVYIAMYFNYGVVFSLMEEGGIPMALSGTAIGFISTLGYLPEVYAPIIAGRTLDAYQGALGYKYYFTFVIAFLVIGFIASLLWSRKVAKNKKDATAKIAA